MQQVLTNPQASPQVNCLRLSGHLNASSSQCLKEQLEQALSLNRAPVVVVDMRDVESLDSAGLMALVSALTIAQQKGVSFVLAGISPSIKIIFELTQLSQVFEIRDDLLESDSFSAAPIAA